MFFAKRCPSQRERSSAKTGPHAGVLLQRKRVGVAKGGGAAGIVVIRIDCETANSEKNRHRFEEKVGIFKYDLIFF